MDRFYKDVSIVFPAFNEEKNIEICIIVAYHILKELVRNFEIIIVNDGSTDKTLEVCLGLTKKFPEVKLISKKTNEGYAFALRDGFAATRYELLFFSDADRQFDIINLKDLLAYIDDYDIVVGFRKNRRDSFQRKFLSKCYNLLVRFVFGINVRDIDCAFKLFKKSVFDKILIESRYFFVNTEILAKASLYGFSLKEVSVSHFPRFEGESKVSISEIPRTLKELFRIYRLIHARKGKT